jgi:hypothetical protein
VNIFIIQGVTTVRNVMCSVGVLYCGRCSQEGNHLMRLVGPLSGSCGQYIMVTLYFVIVRLFIETFSSEKEGRKKIK